MWQHVSKEVQGIVNVTPVLWTPEAYILSTSPNLLDIYDTEHQYFKRVYRRRSRCPQGMTQDEDSLFSFILSPDETGRNCPTIARGSAMTSQLSNARP